MPKRMDALEKKVTEAGEALTDVLKKTTENVTSRIERMRKKLEQSRRRNSNTNLVRVR